MDLVEYLFNICRTTDDVLHILAHLTLMAVAAAIALRCYDRRLYKKYIYKPIYNFIAFRV